MLIESPYINSVSDQTRALGRRSSAGDADPYTFDSGPINPVTTSADGAGCNPEIVVPPVDDICLDDIADLLDGPSDPSDLDPSQLTVSSVNTILEDLPEENENEESSLVGR